MKPSLDCIPCLVRQALDATTMSTANTLVQAAIMRELLRRLAETDLSEPPPRLAQRIHRLLREVTGNNDPYRLVKQRHNRLALGLLPELRILINHASVPLEQAIRLAIAGNIIDMGPKTNITEQHVRESIDQALKEPLHERSPGEFHRAMKTATRILYLADNAGEIAFDRLLIEVMGPERVTVAVRGTAVINDATRADAHAVGLDTMVEVIDNGSDAPGTFLPDCSREFRRRFAESDLIIAKGQGNYESLDEEQHNIFFLFKVKCRVIAAQVGLPVGSHVLTRSPSADSEDYPSRRKQ